MKATLGIGLTALFLSLISINQLLSQNAPTSPASNKQQPSKSQDDDDDGDPPAAESEAAKRAKLAVSVQELELQFPVIRFRSEAALRKAGLETAAAELKELDEFVTAPAVVQYDETRLAQLGSRVPGIAWRVYKNEGDLVHTGDVLAILDSDSVGQAKADLLEASYNHYFKAETMRRLEVAKSLVADRSVRSAEAEEKLAEVRLFNARQSLINLGLRPPVDWNSDHMVANCAKKIQFLGIPESMVAGFGLDVTTANLIPMLAPFDGVVIDRQMVIGEVVERAKAQFTIADVSRMWIRLNVAASASLSVEVGQKVWFSADGIPGEIEGRISWVSTEVEEKTGTVKVRCEADNPVLKQQSPGQDGQRLLRSGETGTGRIHVHNKPTAIMVPNKAVQLHAKRYVVFVAQSDGTAFEPRVVVLGTAKDGSIEIARGIRAGERVVTIGSHLLKAEMFQESTKKEP